MLTHRCIYKLSNHYSATGITYRYHLCFEIALVNDKSVFNNKTTLLFLRCTGVEIFSCDCTMFLMLHISPYSSVIVCFIYWRIWGEGRGRGGENWIRFTQNSPFSVKFSRRYQACHHHSAILFSRFNMWKLQNTYLYLTISYFDYLLIYRLCHQWVICFFSKYRLRCSEQ